MSLPRLLPSLLSALPSSPAGNFLFQTFATPPAIATPLPLKGNVPLWGRGWLVGALVGWFREEKETI
uniref:Putative secreted protein n=1 Tax=Anopheles triannulatus TaxID=58253 RepID=A0A2M4B0F3_9DIPT